MSTFLNPNAIEDSSISKSKLDTALKAEIENTLIAGTGIDITGNTISCTLDTTIFKVVDSLPAAPASGDENKIHLVLSSSSEEENTYDEYLWVNNSWERIGSFRPSVDLSRYAEKSYVDSQIEAEATARTEADAALQTQINGKQDNIDSFSADEKNAFLVSLGLGKIGVISQTQTWTQAADMGYDYVMSGLVRGVIPKSNIDLFTKAGAIFNEESGYFELNGLTDISYEEMRSIYNEYNPNPWNNQQGMLIAQNIRTGLPANNDIIIASPFNGLRLCYACINIEIINMVSVDNKPQFNDLQLAWFYNFKLISIKNIINVSKVTNYTQAFDKCWSLVDVRLMKLSASVSFKDCARLSNSSILYIINNEAATSPITITLHANAYNRCTANADILAALEAHKNISLASAQ